MKKKIFIIALTIMASILLLRPTKVNAAPNVLSYEYANHSFKLSSSNVDWSNGASANGLTPLIGDFTDKFTLNVISATEIDIIYNTPRKIYYNSQFYYGDYMYNSISICPRGDFTSGNDYFSYYGYSDFGDANHRNGTNVKPFFLTINGIGTPIAPSSITYDNGTNVAKFYLTVPTNTEFRAYVYFCTVFEEYKDQSGYDFYYYRIGNNGGSASTYLYLNA